MQNAQPWGGLKTKGEDRAARQRLKGLKRGGTDSGVERSVCPLEEHRGKMQAEAEAESLQQPFPPIFKSVSSSYTNFLWKL